MDRAWKKADTRKTMTREEEWRMRRTNSVRGGVRVNKRAVTAVRKGMGAK